MSTITPTKSTSSPPLASPEVYRFTIDEYERMAELLDGSRVELIDGYLVRKIPKKPPHIWAVMCIVAAMPSLLPPGWTWRKEDPVRIPAFDEPEPDVAVPRGSAEDYRARIPEASDVVRSWPCMQGAGSRSTGSSTWLIARSSFIQNRDRTGTGRALISPPANTFRL
jgi:Uma2 family endonuclease